jgi:general stress protein YciG
MTEEKSVKELASVFGAIGGRANFKKHGKEHMAKIGKKGGKKVKAKWNKIKKAKKNDGGQGN